MIVHLPIPATAEHVAAVWPHIAPFLPALAKRGRVPADCLAGELFAGETQAHLAWHPETKTARALMGTRIFLRGEDRVCEIVWLTGQNRAEWMHLLPDVERWARERIGCVGIKQTGRLGWRKPLEAHGYRLTRIVMEKDF